MTIALLCPTRARPEQFRRMVDSAFATAQTKIRVYYYKSNDDASDYPADIPDKALKCVGPNCPTVHKWNWLAEVALKQRDHKLFMLAADDMVFETKGWDKALLEHYENLENKIHVYALKDSRDGLGTPHPVVTREYIAALSYFLPPLFMHWYVDTWTVEIAKANNCFTHFTDYMLRHDKLNDQGKPDETHLGIRRMGWHSRDQYVAETCKHYLEYEKKRLADIIMNNNLRRHPASIGEQ